VCDDHTKPQWHTGASAAGIMKNEVSNLLTALLQCGKFKNSVKILHKLCLVAL
jgi:hypothetical protein